MWSSHAAAGRGLAQWGSAIGDIITGASKIDFPTSALTGGLGGAAATGASRVDEIFSGLTSGTIQLEAAAPLMRPLYLEVMARKGASADEIRALGASEQEIADLRLGSRGSDGLLPELAQEGAGAAADIAADEADSGVGVGSGSGSGGNSASTPSPPSAAPPSAAPLLSLTALLLLPLLLSAF